MEYKVVPSRSCLHEPCCWARAQPRLRLRGSGDEDVIYCGILSQPSTLPGEAKH